MKEADGEGSTGALLGVAGALAGDGIAWGVAARDVPALEGGGGRAAVGEALAAVAGVGGRALLLGSARQASETLDAVELCAVRDRAVELGVELHLALGEFHPRRFDRGAAEDAIVAGSLLGVRRYHAVVGRMEDRFSSSPPWPVALAAAAAALREWVDRAGRPVVVRTHEEMTTFELCRLLETADRDDLSIGFSPVNVVCRAEDPMRAWSRVAARARTAFLDDCNLVLTPRGADRRLRPIGDGIVPWPEILGDLAARAAGGSPATVFLDLAQARFDVPFRDREWLASQPDLTAGELSRLARRSLAEGAPQTDIGERRGRGWAILGEAARLRTRCG